MSYQEELVKRLMSCGEWEQLTSERRETFEKLDEQLAGALMTWQDEEEANCAQPRRGTSEGRKAAEMHFLKSFRTLAEAFGGGLIYSQHGSIRLTNLGFSLGVFLHEAEKVGCSIPQFENQLINLTSGCMTLVKALQPPCELNDNP